ncbi:MAG: hypothetical protein MRY79_05035, partial [Alphaproteobacteria bacterium]|nr:hypothetical protein [Alphaproteobacteria bacterium]
MTSLCLGLLSLAYLYFVKSEHFFVNMKGGSYAIAAGAAVLLAELSVFYLFSHKAALSLYVPAMSAGAMILVA